LNFHNAEDEINLYPLLYYSATFLVGYCFFNFGLNYSFGPSICQVILVWSSSSSLSQFGPHFLKNDSIWSLPLILTRRC